MVRVGRKHGRLRHESVDATQLGDELIGKGRDTLVHAGVLEQFGGGDRDRVPR